MAQSGHIIAQNAQPMQFCPLTTSATGYPLALRFCSLSCKTCLGQLCTHSPHPLQTLSCMVTFAIKNLLFLRRSIITHPFQKINLSNRGWFLHFWDRNSSRNGNLLKMIVHSKQFEPKNFMHIVIPIISQKPKKVCYIECVKTTRNVFLLKAQSVDWHSHPAPLEIAWIFVNDTFHILRPFTVESYSRTREFESKNLQTRWNYARLWN